MIDDLPDHEKKQEMLERFKDGRIKDEYDIRNFHQLYDTRLDGRLQRLKNERTNARLAGNKQKYNEIQKEIVALRKKIKKEEHPYELS